MKKTFCCRNMFYSLGMIIFLVLLISACTSGSSTPAPAPTPPIVSNFQNATVVIGQADFISRDANVGGVAANTIWMPYGNPVVYNGILYVPDFGNDRILCFNTVPTSNGANADFVLGQPDLVTSGSGDANNQFSGPQTIKVSGGKFFVTDNGNNRILIWNTPPTTTQVAADIVVGQTGFGLEVAAATQSNLDGPESIEVAGGKLIVADSNNNRILIFNTIPTSNGANADVVLGQSDFVHNTANDDNQDGADDGAPTARTLDYPSGVWSDGTRLIVADNNNNRILIWNTIPTSNFTPADIVLGHSVFTNGDANNGLAAPTAQTLYGPYFIDSNDTQLVVAEADNNRVLIWNTIPTANFTAADEVLGQSDFIHNAANDDNQDGVDDGAPTARTLSYPAGVYIYGTKLFVADNANNRFLIF